MSSQSCILEQTEALWPPQAPKKAVFIDRVYEVGNRSYRDLPWRYDDDAYEVLVSEIMLQQTQVARVKGFWKRFLKRFPTLDALASADVSDVLSQWQGLGYNRRALSLKKTADICSAHYGGCLPDSVEKLQELPGIGPATAAGVMAFAHNKPAIYLETNVRAVFIHELFPGENKISDRDIIPLVELTCPQNNPRDWYYALLDFGAYLKQTGANPSRKSAHYARQSTFEGSRRQKRSALLRIVLACETLPLDEAYARLDTFEVHAGRDTIERCEFESIVKDMVAEGFFRLENEKLMV